MQKYLALAQAWLKAHASLGGAIVLLGTAITDLANDDYGGAWRAAIMAGSVLHLWSISDSGPAPTPTPAMA